MAEKEETLNLYNELEPGYWAQLPATMLEDQRVGHAPKLLYAVIGTLTRRRGYCWASNAYLAERMGANPKRIWEWLSELVDAGYVTIEDAEGGRGKQRKIWPRWGQANHPEKRVANHPEKRVAPLDMESKDKQEREKSAPARAIVEVDFPDDPEVQAEWETYIKNRKQMGHRITPISRDRHLKKLRAWKRDVQLAALRSAIASGYRDVFEPKKPSQPKIPWRTREERINRLNERKRDLIRTNAPYWKIHEIDMELSKL